MTATISLGTPYLLAGRAQSVKRLHTGWAVRGSNPGWCETFLTSPYRTCMLLNGYREPFLGLKRSAP
jgi:hypothetical protein